MKQNLFIYSFSLIGLILFSCNKEEDNNSENIKACFSYLVTENTLGEVEFKNCSENASSYFWDFGDGTNSYEKEPKHIFGGNFPYSVKLIAINGSKKDSIVKQVTEIIVVYKPNIYIYPLVALDNFLVKIDFPNGGAITESIPEYKNGWLVNIDSNGVINGKYNFLFYESRQANLFQYDKGWCVSKNDLKSFFENNLHHYNYSNLEIKDFLDYWIPKLNTHDYYVIYPQTNCEIEKMISLNFSIQPDHINRLFYGIEAQDSFVKIDEPSIIRFKREGFYVMEWGGFFK